MDQALSDQMPLLCTMWNTYFHVIKILFEIVLAFDDFLNSEEEFRTVHIKMQTKRNKK